MRGEVTMRYNSNLNKVKYGMLDNAKLGSVKKLKKKEMTLLVSM